MDGEIDQHKSFVDVFSDSNALEAFLQAQETDTDILPKTTEAPDALTFRTFFLFANPISKLESEQSRNSVGSLLDMYLNRPPDYTTLPSDRNSKTFSLQKNAVKFSNAAFNFPSEMNFSSEFSPPRAQPNFIMQQNVNINSFSDDCSPSEVYQTNFDKSDGRSNANLKSNNVSKRAKDIIKTRAQRPIEMSQNVELPKNDSLSSAGSNPAVLNQMIGSQTNINVIVNHTIFEPSTASATPSITTFTDKTASSNPSPFMFINGAQLANQMQQSKPRLFNTGGRILPYNAVQKILESKQQINQQKLLQQQQQKKQQETLYLQQMQQRLQQQQQQQQQQSLKVPQQQLFQQYQQQQQQQQQRRVQLPQQQISNLKSVQSPKRLKNQTRRSVPISNKKMTLANSPHTFVLNSQGLSLLNQMSQGNSQSNSVPQNNQTYLLNEVLRVTPTSSTNSNQNVLPSHFLVKQQSSSNPILISYPQINSATPLQGVVSGLTQPVVLGNSGQVNSIQQKQSTQIIIPSASVSNLNNIRLLIPQSVSFNNKNIAPKLLQGGQVVNLASTGASNSLMPVRNLIPVLQQQQQQRQSNKQQLNAQQHFQTQNNQQLQSQLQQLVQQQQLQQFIQQQQQQQRDKTSFQQLMQQFQSSALKTSAVMANISKNQQSPVIKPSQRINSTVNRAKKVASEHSLQMPHSSTLTCVTTSATNQPTLAAGMSTTSNPLYQGDDTSGNSFLMNSTLQQPKVVIIPHQGTPQIVQSSETGSVTDPTIKVVEASNIDKSACFQDISARKPSRSPCTENELSPIEQFKIITANIRSLSSMVNPSSREESVVKQLKVKRMEVLKQIEPTIIEQMRSSNPELFQIDLNFFQLNTGEALHQVSSSDTRGAVAADSLDRVNSEQLKKLRFVDMALLQAHGLYQKNLSDQDIAEILRLEEHVVRSLPAQQQDFIKNQVEIVKQIIEKRVECEGSAHDEMKVDVMKCNQESDTTLESFSIPKKESSSEETETLKKIALCEKFYKRLQQDHHNVLHPDTTHPFYSMGDACDRLLCYHVYAKHGDMSDESGFNEEYSKLSEKLLTKINNLKRRYRKLRLDECIVGIPTKIEQVLVAKLNLEMETENKGLFASRWSEDCFPQKRLKLGSDVLPIGCDSHVEAIRLSYSTSKYGSKAVEMAMKDLCGESDHSFENMFLDSKTLSDRHKTINLTNSDAHDLSDDDELVNIFNNVLEFDAG